MNCHGEDWKLTDVSSMYGMGMLAEGGTEGDADAGDAELEKPKALTCCLDTARKARIDLGRSIMLMWNRDAMLTS